jgi:RNA polymerase sigma-70 factor (ECF subfamily)
MATNWKVAFDNVRAALMRRGRTTHDADDLVQEAWLRLACYEREQTVVKPEAFLMRTALNLSIDTYRMHATRGEEVVPEEVVLMDPAPDVEAILLGRERMTRFSQCVGRLNQKTRDIFLAHRIDGMSYQEIAGRHQISISTVEKHIAKALAQITAWMEGW